MVLSHQCFGLLVGVVSVEIIVDLRGSAPMLANSFEGSGQQERGKVEVGAGGMVWVTAGSGQQVAVVVNGGTRPLPRVNLPHLCRPMTANMETNQKCGEGHTKLRAETRVWLRRRERQLLLLNDCMCCRKVGLLPGADPRCGSSACSSSEYNSVGTMGSSCNLKKLCPDPIYAHAANCTQLTIGSLEPQDSPQAGWWAQSGEVALSDELWSSSSLNDKDIECQKVEVEYGAGVNQSMLCDACQVDCYSYAHSCVLIFPPVVIFARPLAAYGIATPVVRARSSSMLGRVCVVCVCAV